MSTRRLDELGGVCRGCGARIWWAETHMAKRWMPVEPDGSGKRHRCPAQRRERARGYAVDPARVARERAALDELYADPDRATTEGGEG